MRRILMKKKQQNRAFTLVEMLVVISIIALLAAFMLVALGGSKEAAKTVDTSTNLKEVGVWMELWSGEHDGNILPSRFDFVDEAESGSRILERRNPNAQDDNPNDTVQRGQYQGTWSDILWTNNSLHQTFGLRDMTVMGDSRWESDSPDDDIYDVHENFDHPFRSRFLNTRGASRELPGYFAANNFFDSRSGSDGNPNSTDRDSTIDWYFTYSMLNAPARSIYLVDSVVGETITPSAKAWEVSNPSTSAAPLTHLSDDPTGDVDFRYGDDCMVLLLDGSVDRVARWTQRGPITIPGGNADQTLLGRGYRVHQLNLRKPTE